MGQTPYVFLMIHERTPARADTHRKFLLLHNVACSRPCCVHDCDAASWTLSGRVAAGIATVRRGGSAVSTVLCPSGLRRSV